MVQNVITEIFNVTKDFYFKYISTFYFFSSWKKVSQFQPKIQSNVFNIDNNTNVYWAANQHIIMISKGSCDTEDWSNDAEYSALPSQEYIIFLIYI